jgi:hypothetical protein
MVAVAGPNNNVLCIKNRNWVEYNADSGGWNPEWINSDETMDTLLVN